MEREAVEGGGGGTGGERKGEPSFFFVFLFFTAWVLVEVGKPT